jgi:hypothetical protein
MNFTRKVAPAICFSNVSLRMPGLASEFAQAKNRAAQLTCLVGDKNVAWREDTWLTYFNATIFD